MTPLMKSKAWATGQTAEAKGVSMMDTSATIENLNALAAITETPIIKIFTDKRSTFNNINHKAIQDAAYCYGWDRCEMLTHMHKDIKYRLRMTAVGVHDVGGGHNRGILLHGPPTGRK
jgi:hypothetical protein